MPASIFVSYSHRDAGLVKPVVGLLRATKGLVFQDVEAVQPGSRWRPQIAEALRVAHLIVLFWCYHSSRSAEVRKEYELALSTGKDVLPVLLDATPLPKELNEYQWVDFRQFVGLGHRSLNRWLAIAAAASVLMGFLGVMVFVKRDVPTELRAPLPAEPAPGVEVPSSPAERPPPLPMEPPVKPAPSPRPPLPTEPAPQRPLPPRMAPPAPPAPFPWGLIILPATLLVLVICLVRRIRRSKIRKEMATTLQEELFRRGIGSV